MHLFHNNSKITFRKYAQTAHQIEIPPDSSPFVLTRSGFGQVAVKVRISLGWDLFLGREVYNKLTRCRVVYTMALIIPDEAHGLTKCSYGDDAPQNDT